MPFDHNPFTFHQSMDAALASVGINRKPLAQVLDEIEVEREWTAAHRKDTCPTCGGSTEVPAVDEFGWPRKGRYVGCFDCGG